MLEDGRIRRLLPPSVPLSVPRDGESKLRAADDVVFSFARAAAEGSDIKVSVSPIKSVRAVDPQTVEIVTDGPDPILLREIPYVYILSKAWAVQHQAEAPNGVRTDRMSYATTHTNGTGPFRLVDRTPDTSTTLERNRPHPRRPATSDRPVPQQPGDQGR